MNRNWTVFSLRKVEQFYRSKLFEKLDDNTNSMILVIKCYFLLERDKDESFTPEKTFASAPVGILYTSFLPVVFNFRSMVF